MACDTAWNSAQHAIHDRNVEKVLTEGDSAINCALAIRQNFNQIGRHIDNIAKACGARAAVTRKLDPRLDVMLGQMEKIGRNIFKVPVHKMSDKEIKAHHDGLDAILPLLRDNAEQATKLAQFWTEMHKQLEAVAGLFK